MVGGGKFGIVCGRTYAMQVAVEQSCFEGEAKVDMVVGKVVPAIVGLCEVDLVRAFGSHSGVGVVVLSAIAIAEAAVEFQHTATDRVVVTCQVLVVVFLPFGV